MQILRSRVLVCFKVKNRSKNKSQEQLKIVFNETEEIEKRDVEEAGIRGKFIGKCAYL